MSDNPHMAWVGSYDPTTRRLPPPPAGILVGVLSKNRWIEPDGDDQWRATEQATKILKPKES